MSRWPASGTSASETPRRGITVPSPFGFGVFARHAASNAVLLSLLLEDALMSKATTLNHFMVSDPIYAALSVAVAVADLREVCLAQLRTAMQCRQSMYDS
jgi:hypothetical protein